MIVTVYTYFARIQNVICASILCEYLSSKSDLMTPAVEFELVLFKALLACDSNSKWLG